MDYHYFILKLFTHSKFNMMDVITVSHKGLTVTEHKLQSTVKEKVENSENNIRL